MNNPRLAARYAKSIIGLAIEQGQLDSVYADMKFIRFVCKSSPDFVSVLKSPIFTSDKKQQLIESVTQERISQLSTLFIRLLVRKTRENALPEIAEAVLDQYNQIKGIHKVKLTTASPLSPDLQEMIVSKIKSNTPIQQIELETSVNDSIIGGFKLEIGDMLIDASILRDLNDVKKQFLSNDYVHKLR
jgi:F-type H+-transporting ATPase subunit delta